MPLIRFGVWEIRPNPVFIDIVDVHREKIPFRPLAIPTYSLIYEAKVPPSRILPQNARYNGHFSLARGYSWPSGLPIIPIRQLFCSRTPFLYLFVPTPLVQSCSIRACRVVSPVCHGVTRTSHPLRCHNGHIQPPSFSIFLFFHLFPPYNETFDRSWVPMFNTSYRALASVPRRRGAVQCTSHLAVFMACLRRWG
ncbi:hypothetical protein BDN70DRAFT_285759 [Pholiota conissans]|uniref:Uncharacterized protein n=1 Tax=Pholiota conissans TaxID=109636 RepID=A0A9P5YUJ1_9AGAR|nr:hypothetical protein BDN70DRAFT_285759 [Pholiota conissans]